MTTAIPVPTADRTTALMGHMTMSLSAADIPADITFMATPSDPAATTGADLMGVADSARPTMEAVEEAAVVAVSRNIFQS